MYKVLCETDLQRKYPNWNTAKVLANLEIFNQVLWYEGIDARYPVDTQTGFIHRDASGNLTDCVRWVGLERTDKEWLFSDRCSLEAQYFSADQGTKHDMRALLAAYDCGGLEKQDQEALAFTIGFLAAMYDPEK